MAFKRHDGRKINETREIEAKVGVIQKAQGSAYFRIGKTAAYAGVYGPRELHPKFLQNPKTGKLRCTYNCMPFSGTGERIRPGPSRRSKEISMVTEGALLPVLDLSDYPNAVVDVFIEIPHMDAGSRCAGICAAAMALADAGFKMSDIPVAVAAGCIEGNVFIDPDYMEENPEGKEAADLPVAVLPRTGEITLLQMDGELEPEKIQEMIELVKEVAKSINEVQKNALKAKFDRGELQ